jgi:hypothetical protein
MGWSVEKSRDIHTITFNERLTKSGPQYILLTGDRHWDNPHSNWKLQKEHLELAKERNAPIIDIGDFFCAMQESTTPAVVMTTYARCIWARIIWAFC